MIKIWVQKCNIGEMQRFAIVGILAACVHYGAGMVYITYVHKSIVIANIMAYFTALVVSVVGHAYFSFYTRLSWQRFWRFFGVSLSAMGVSTLVAYVINSITKSPEIALLAGIFVSAGYTYILSKVFAFK